MLLFGVPVKLVKRSGATRNRQVVMTKTSVCSRLDFVIRVKTTRVSRRESRNRCFDSE